MINRRGDEENEDWSSKEEVGDLGDGPVFEESDVPVLRLYECVHQRQHVSAPWSGWRWRTETLIREILKPSQGKERESTKYRAVNDFKD